ncbi:uncharacterized protein LOC127001255 isoform X4 [Eriocheir sinensis]|uniref:uncharacterized protein LOC127001255 isoform X4 n=1 Tax=Eriocheir sinensis TaxID=95602 RepID=UPI0021C9F59C|nr:uncharacterized protein LOC127001255 isoform X4 [Eriocheir sinensis]
MVQTGVLVAALLALGAGGALNPASAQQLCGAPDQVVRYSEDEVMFSSAEGGNLSSEGFVKPRNDFAGISVKVNQRNVQHVAWFPADPCFPDTGEKWEWMRVEVTMLQYMVSKICFVHFRLVTDYCHKVCHRYDNVLCGWWSLEDLSVVARGPSNWKSDHPGRTCLVNVSSPSHPPLYTCENPPFRPPSGTPPSTTTTPTTTTITSTIMETTSTTTATDPFPFPASSASSSPSVVLLIVVAVVIFLVVVVVVVVCRRRRRRRSAASRPCFTLITIITTDQQAWGSNIITSLTHPHPRKTMSLTTT